MITRIVIYLMIGLGVATGRDLHTGQREQNARIIATRILIWPATVSTVLYTIALRNADLGVSKKGPRL